MRLTATTRSLGFVLAIHTLAYAAEPGLSVRRHVSIGWTSTKPAQPFVTVQIGDVTSHALVDTGASDHVIASSLVESASLPTVSLRAQGVDHGAGSLQLSGLAHTDVSIAGWGPLEASLSTTKDGTAFAVAGVHPRFQELGLGAFVSPQRLVTAGHAVVVDLAASEIVEVPVTQLRAYLDAKGGASLFTAGSEVCKHGKGTRSGTTWIADALIEGHPARLLVDTGAAYGDLFRDSVVGRALVGRDKSNTTMVTAGSTLDAERISDITVRLGEVQRSKLRWTLVPSQGKPVCPYDGVLGIDVLRSCVVAFDGQTMSGRCPEMTETAEPPKKTTRPRKKGKR